MRAARALTLGLAVALLTLLTQVGGVLLLACWFAARRKPARALALFAMSYAALTVLVLPLVAPRFGRVALPCRAAGELPLRSASLGFCALNRHYVRPELRARLETLARELEARHPGSVVHTLDAGFPLGGPLLPHLGHHDGRQVDLALFYAGGGLRSAVGYFAFEGPQPSDPRPCRGREGAWRWDLEWLQPLFPDRAVDEKRTRAALRWLVDDPAIGRVFVEPHLARRLGVRGTRFQGCRAARHDDHVHVELAR